MRHGRTANACSRRSGSLHPIIAALIAVVTFAWCVPVFAQGNYVVDARFYRIREAAWPPEFRNSEGLSGIVTANEPETIVGTLRLRVEDGTLEWVGEEDADNPNVVFLGMPKMVIQPKTAAEIVLNDEPPEYFERQSAQAPDLFVHKKLERVPGIRVQVTVEPQDADIVNVYTCARVAVVTGREPIEGVRLDVGKPILSEGAESPPEPFSKVSARLGDWLLFSKPVPDADPILTMIRITADKAGIAAGPAPSSISTAKYRATLRFLEAAPEAAERVLQHFHLDANAVPRVGKAQLLGVPRVQQQSKTFEVFADSFVGNGVVCIASPSLIVATGGNVPRTAASDKPAADSQKDDLFGTQPPNGSTGWTLVTNRCDVPVRNKDGTSASNQDGDQIELDFRGFDAGVCICPTDDRQRVTLDLGFRSKRDCEGPKKGDAPGEAEEVEFAFQIPARLGEWLGFTTTYEKTGRRVIVLAMITEDGAAEEKKTETAAVAEPAKAPEADKAVKAKYWTSLHFLEVAPEAAQQILGHFEVAEIPEPIYGKPQFLKVPSTAREGKALGDFVHMLTKNGAVCILSPRFDLDAKPKLSQQDPREGRVPRELHELVAKLPQDDSSDWGVSTWGHSFRVPAEPEADSTQRVGDDRRTAQRRRSENQPKYDFRGFSACTFIRPTEDAQRVLLEAAFVSKRDYESPETPGEGDETQFACEAAVQLGEWFGFVTTYEKTGWRMIVLGEVTDEAPAQEEGETMPPRPPLGLQVSAETMFLRIPAQHRATVMDALAVDDTVKPLLGDVTVFRDINTSAFPKVAAGNQSQLAFSTLHDEWLERLEPKVELISAPRVTTFSKTAAAEVRRHMELQPETSLRPSLRGANGVQSVHRMDAEGRRVFEERKRALCDVNPMLARMAEEDVPGLAIIVDHSSYALPDGTIEWLGVLVGVSLDESETPGFLDTDVTLDYRWDAALPRKRLLGVLPFKHERDVRAVQCGIHLSVPDEGWVGFLFPWEEGEDGIMVVLWMDTIDPTGAGFREATAQTESGAQKVVERRKDNLE